MKHSVPVCILNEADWYNRTMAYISRISQGGRGERRVCMAAGSHWGAGAEPPALGDFYIF